MIAADTSAWIDYSKGVDSPGSNSLHSALEAGVLLMPPLVLVELLSSPKLTSEAEAFVSVLPRLELQPGYWERTAATRKVLLKRGLKAKLGDCLIAQSCIDEDVALITEDEDFRNFARFGLKLA